jgi:DNA polymerase-3 subunit alpha
MNKRMVESLIRAGAFDGMGASRSQYLSVYEQTMESAVRRSKQNITGQVSLFDSLGEENLNERSRLPLVKEVSRHAILAMEKEMTGLYISGHPLDEYSSQLEKLSVNSSMFSEDLETPLVDGQTVHMGGIITDVKTKTTKNNDIMAFVTVDDLYGSVEVIVFPSVYKLFRSLLVPDSIVLFEGRASFREGESGKVVAQNFQSLEKGNEVEKLYLKFYSKLPEFTKEAVLGLLHKHPGPVPVYVFDEASGKKYLLGSRITADESMLNTLRDLMGPENIKTSLRS